MSEFVYLYGFMPADASPPSNLAGVGNHGVQVVPIDGIKAAISHVPADEYDPARIEEKLQDLSWVAAQGAAHETVVAWFVDHSQILPAPLFTLYSSERALQDALVARSREIQAELQRLENKREWDVKISFDERQVEKHAGEISPRIAEIEKELASAAPGKRYLLEKKRNDLLKAETRSAAGALAQEALDSAARLSADVRSLPLPRATEAADLPVILYAALLADRDREVDVVQALEQQAARLASLGMNLAFSGPWAPYRFTGEHERATAG